MRRELGDEKANPWRSTLTLEGRSSYQTTVMPRSVRHLCLLAALCLSRSAWGQRPAEAPDARLVYEGAENASACPATSKVLEDAVAARLGRYPFRDDAKALVHVSLVLNVGRVHAVVRLADATGKVVGRRELASSAADCSELIEALAVSISLGLDPVQGPLAGAKSPPAEAPEPEGDAAPPPPAPTPRAEHMAEPEPPPSVSEPLETTRDQGAWDILCWRSRKCGGPLGSPLGWCVAGRLGE